MFEAMRRNTKLIMWITTGSFVLLIFLAWGAEYQGFGRGKKGPTAGVIGRINGEAIRTTAYEDQINQIRANLQAQGQTVTDAEEVQLRNQAWESMVQDLLVGQEIHRLGIQVSDQEIVDAIRTQPIPQVMQSPDFQTNGKFDYSKYLSALNDPSRDWTPLENYYRVDLPKEKLQQIVVASVKIDDADLKRQFDAENTKAKVEYVVVQAARFAKANPAADDAGVRAYYDAHKDDYRTDEQAWIQMVKIDKKATASDTTAAQDLIRQAVKDAKDGQDFATLVSTYSDAPAQLRGGKDGVYMTKDQFGSAPKVGDAAFTLPVGQVSEVITESNGYHLFKVEDRRTTGDKVEVKIADVFVPVSLSPETLSGYRDRAEGVLNAARESQGNLSEAAQKDGFTASDVGPFGRRSFLPRLGQISGFTDWVFNAAEGKLTMMETPDAWYVMRLVRRRPAGVAPFDEVKDRVRLDYGVSLQVDEAKKHAEAILALAKGGTPLDQAAKTDTTATFDRPDEFTRNGFVRGLGNDPAVMARIFADPIGLVPQVITTKRGCYVVNILSRTQPDESLFAAQKEQLRKQFVQSHRRDVINRWMEDLRARAKIEDYRTDTGI